MPDPIATTDPSTTPETQIATESAVSAAAEAERILSLRAPDQRTLLDEIRRAERENPDFKAAFENHVGRKAERQYKPEIARRDAQIAELQTQLRRNELQQMTEEDISARFASDPAFAKEYAEIVHHKPQPVQDVDPTPHILAAAEDIEDFAKGRGMSDETWNGLLNKAGADDYWDHNKSWQENIRRFERDVTEELLKGRTSSEKPAITNSALAGGGPDVSARGGGSGPKSWPKTASEFNNLPISQQRSIVQTAEGQNYVSKLKG